jgi:two-component system, NtrC family, response regulator
MSGRMRKLLFVEDDLGLQRQLRWSFSDYEVMTASDRSAAISCISIHQPPVVVLDLGLPPDPDGASEGLATLETIRTTWPRIKVIIMTGNEDRSHALHAVGLGAYDYCDKPVEPDLLKMIISRAEHLQELEEELWQATQSTTDSPIPGLITCDPTMMQVCRTAAKVANSDITVLLLGESGTGKDLIAQALHNFSPRRAGPFVAINCAAIPESLLESELFGHEKGSFTGAIKQTIGKLELAQRGTIFLDEIADMPLALQVKLLRFLQERVIERVGGRQLIPVDVRVVCATNRRILEMVRAQQFREDLYYRLNELSLRIPALRERAGDALVLAHYFLNKFSQQDGRSVKGFSTEAKTLIEGYDWPGNVRELQSQIRRAVLMSESDLVSASDFDLPASPKKAALEAIGADTLKGARRSAERLALTHALATAKGNISRAAKLLGVSRPTLYELMRTHDVRP